MTWKPKPAKKLEAITDPKVTARLLDKVEESPNGCWLWTGCKDKRGYGKIKVAGVSEWAHRIAYAIFHGTIHEKMTVNHKCSNAGCVNPAHLELMTVSDNSKERYERHGGIQKTDQQPCHESR